MYSHQGLGKGGIMSFIIRRWRTVLAGLIAGLAILFSAAPASAYWWTHPQLYNRWGGYIPMYYVPNDDTNIKVWLPNTDRFYPECYVDNDWSYGNYWTNRWFRGTDAWGYWGFISASYVINQIPVPRC
jgi:hypothetical protein